MSHPLGEELAKVHHPTGYLTVCSHTFARNIIEFIKVISLNTYFSVMTEDGATVEWAVILRIVQPTLQVMRVYTAQADTDNMGRGVMKLPNKITLANQAQCNVKRDRGEKLLVSNLLPRIESDTVTVKVEANYLGVIPLFVVRK